MYELKVHGEKTSFSMQFEYLEDAVLEMTFFLRHGILASIAVNQNQKRLTPAQKRAKEQALKWGWGKKEDHVN